MLQCYKPCLLGVILRQMFSPSVIESTTFMWKCKPTKETDASLNSTAACPNGQLAFPWRATHKVIFHTI